MDNLIWQAFQYLSEELSESEREAFELQLETDQQAQRALVRAGEIYGTVFDCYQSAESVVSQPTAIESQSVSSRNLAASRWSMVSIVAACLLALAYFVFPVSDSSPNVAQQNDSSLQEAGELVFLWSESGPQDEAISIADDEELSDDELSSSDDLLVPGWMLAAVSPNQSENDGLPIESFETQ